MELKEFKLSTGKIAYLKPELTAGDFDELVALSLDCMEYDAGELMKATEEKPPEPKKMEAGKLFIARKYKLLSLCVKWIKLEDETRVEPITEDFLKEMKITEIDELKAEVDRIQEASSLSETAKKK